MSATSMVPQCSRPGSSRWPVLRRKNVTVRQRLTATPITAPVVPFMPLGRSTAIIGAAAAFIALDHGARQSFDVAVEAGAEQRVDDDVAIAQHGRRGLFHGPLHRSAANAASPLIRLDSPTKTHATYVPRSERCRAATNPSPPLLPGPATTMTRRPCHPGGGIGHCAARILHKVETGNAASDGQTVRFRHFRSREQFNHRGRDYRPILGPTIRTNWCAATSLWRLAKSLITLLNLWASALGNPSRRAAA